MSTVTARGLMCASVVLTAVSSLPAAAELPAHRSVMDLHATAAEDNAPDEGIPNAPDFGAAVAVRNGIAFVGIPGVAPTSHVAVVGQTTTGWVRTATLTVRDAIPADARDNGFGRAITFRDGLAVIASYSLLHVFKRSNGVWTDVQKLVPPKNAATGLLEVSAMRYENGILAVGSGSAGLVSIYELAPDGKLVKRATLRAPGGQPGDGFGTDVGVAGNAVVVGGAQSAVFVFKRRSDGSWVRTQKLVAADSSPVASFGAAVAIDRGMIIAGAPEHDCYAGGFGSFCGSGSPDGSGAGGAAYGFVPIGGQYVQVFKLRPRSDEHSNYWQFGRRIAMFDKHIVIDADVQRFASDPDFSDLRPGLGFSYTRDGSTLTARGLTGGYTESDSMALANNWLFVGTMPDSSACNTEFLACFGVVHVFDLNRFEQ